jgi:hypothetical protein
MSLAKKRRILPTGRSGINCLAPNRPRHRRRRPSFPQPPPPRTATGLRRRRQRKRKPSSRRLPNSWPSLRTGSVLLYLLGPLFPPPSAKAAGLTRCNASRQDQRNQRERFIRQIGNSLRQSLHMCHTRRNRICRQSILKTYKMKSIFLPSADSKPRLPFPLTLLKLITKKLLMTNLMSNDSCQ